VESKIIGQYTHIFTNNAQELTPTDLNSNATQPEEKVFSVSAEI
jgi:hypothetical protein